VLLRELRAQGYTGRYTILKSYLQPLRLRRAVSATMRFETKPGEQAQVDFGRFPFRTGHHQPVLPGGGLSRRFPFSMLRTRTARRFAVQRCGVSDASSAMPIHLLPRSDHGFSVDSIRRGAGYNGVLIMVLVTSVLGPVLTQRFAPRMLGSGAESPPPEHEFRLTLGPGSPQGTTFVVEGRAVYPRGFMRGPLLRIA
jgi:hypothetical protein